MQNQLTGVAKKKQDRSSYRTVDLSPFHKQYHRDTKFLVPFHLAHLYHLEDCN